MSDQTKLHLHLNNHVYHASGKAKTVCVSTCLSFFGISPDQYNYTKGYANVLRRFDYSVRSRMSELKVKAHRTTMTELKAELRKSNYSNKDYFTIEGIQTKKAHLMVLNGNGEIVIDTAKGMKWRIRKVYQILK